MENIGKRIKSRRIYMGLSAEELAPLVGLNAATIYRYENGGIKKVNTTKLQPFAKALKTTEAYLMGWVDSPEIPEESSEGKFVTLEKPGNSPSDEALAVAIAYDQMTPYGRSLIDLIVENEKLYGRGIRIISSREEERARMVHEYAQSLFETEQE